MNDMLPKDRSRQPVWRRQGEEPDYRFTLANERTFLAWIRTALAVLAAGVLLDQFSTKIHPHLLVVLVAALLCLLAASLSMVAYQRWRDNEVAMRHKKSLSHSKTLAVLTGFTFAACAVLATLIVATAYGK